MEATEAKKPSLRDFLYVVFKRKTGILIFFCATVFAVTLGTYLWKPTYEATSQVLVKIGRENVYMPARGDVSPVVRIDREEQLNSEIQILKGRSLIEEVVNSIGPTVIYKDLTVKETGIVGAAAEANKQEMLVNEATHSLQKSLEVRGIKKSNVIEVSFKHNNPKMAALVVNKLVKLFLDRHLEVHKNPHSYRFFKEQSEIYKKRLVKAEQRLEALKADHDITSLEEERRLYLAQQGDLKNDLNRTVVQEAETKNRVIQIRRQLAATSKVITQEREVVTNPYLINTLEARLVELELKEKELLGKYTEGNRLVRNVRAEIEMVRKKLKDQEGKDYGKTLFGPNVVHQRLQEELFRNEADLTALRAKKKALTSQLAEYREKLEKLNAIEMELNQLKNQLALDQENYGLYLKKFEESRISNAMDEEKIANIRVLEPAVPPLRPVSPKKRLNLALGVFLGMFGGLFLAFLMEYLDDSLDRPEDVEEHLRLPVLVSIPEFKG
ncbi:MAG: GumC family protein [Deltaproteobacteria bacterium]|nr:GumC family protein [Deltaproteobacteria bacterium]